MQMMNAIWKLLLDPENFRGGFYYTNKDYDLDQATD